ncbi:unnamed protein product [Symbiodinium sp. KB8]|nr:unnamed protein product [Symbiodinium sp. KB8]
MTTVTTAVQIISGQEASGYKGSFSEKMAVPSFDAQSTGEALLLYQHLSGRAWVESEELHVDDLAGSDGAKAWAYLNALSLSSSEELALLASVGPPQDTAKGGKGVRATFMAGIDEGDDDDEGIPVEDEQVLAEEEAVALHEAYAAQDVAENTAKFKHLNVGDIALAVTDNGHPAIVVNPSSWQNPRFPSPQEWADDEVKLLPFAERQYVLHDAFMTSNLDASAEQPKPDRISEPKLPSRGPRLVFPRPSLELCLSSPMASSSSDAPKNLWQMNKVQLLAEATRLGITTHPTWSTGEVRQLISDKRKTSADTGAVPKGLASMTKDQLSEECIKLGITPPTGATKGHLQLLIRDTVTAGQLSHDVRSWQPRGDLVNLASYAETVLDKKMAKGYNPEDNPAVPLPPDDASVGSAWESERSALTEVANLQTEDGAEAPTGDGRKQPYASGATAGVESRDRRTHDTPGNAQGSLQPLGRDHMQGDALGEDFSSSELEFEVDSPPLHVLPGVRGEDTTSGETFYECQEAVPHSAAETAGQTNEHRARELLGRKDFSFEVPLDNSMHEVILSDGSKASGYLVETSAVSSPTPPADLQSFPGETQEEHQTEQDYTNENCALNVPGMIENLQPNIVWFRRDEHSIHHIHAVMNTIYQQLEGTISADLESGLQAHWRQGVIERHGYWYQEILQRVIDEKSITKDDMYMAVQAVNTATNELDTGVDEERFLEIMSSDQRRQREVRMIQRARVKRGGYAVGELVCFYRIEKVATKRGQWRGPGTIIGHEGGNWWVSFGGRCHLVAEEHLRPATSEELGELFSTRVARDDLERLLELDPDDPETFEPSDQERQEPDDPAQELPPVPDDDFEDMEYEPSLPGEGVLSDMFEGPSDEPRGAKRDGDVVPPIVPRRVRQKTPGRKVHSVIMLKRCQTERALEKQLEKEIPWKLVPPEEHAALRGAEQKQIQEHYDHDALEPLSIEESARVKDRVHSSRILSSRFAYRDKHWSRRKIDASVPWKHKARLVVSGHRDPDIPHLETDAPTIGRLTIVTLFQVVARKWWRKLRRDMIDIKIEYEGQSLQFSQCPLDPCPFQLRDPESRKPLAYVGVHVDELLVVGPRGLVGCIKGSLSCTFPVDGWEDDTFEYIGSHARVSDEGVFIGQESYASSRLFEVEVARGQDELEQATEAQRIDNQSLIGALSWLSAQTRPDLQCSVSLAQQLQKTPTVEDIKFSNKIAKRAWEHREKGVWLRPLDLSSLEYLVYHDSARANTLLDGEEHFILSTEDHENGTMTGGPFDKKARKARKENSKVASQIGVPRVPSDKRLAIDLAALRQTFNFERVFDRMTAQIEAALVREKACEPPPRGGGQKNQFDAADEAKVKQVILVGTMTGTQKDSFLNSIGDGDGDQIVMWKRKAEMYLIDKCQAGKMKYTIIHAGRVWSWEVRV